MRLPLLRIAAGSQWIRIHRCHHSSALHWGVLYVAGDLETAFAETFGHQVMASHLPAAVKFLSRQELEERCIARLTARRDLQVLDLRGAALARLNLDAQLLSTCEQLPAPSEPSRNELPTTQPSSAARCSVYAGSRNLPFSMRNASFPPLICNCAGVCTAVQIQGGDQVVMVVCLPLSHQAPLPERGAGAVRLQEHGSTRSRTTCSRLSRTT